MISVIIPNFNHKRYLQQRIESVLNQDYKDIEVIILDDCSTDDSRSVIEAYRDNNKVSHIVYNEQNGGSPFKQWHKGICLAKGDWIWIAESDDYSDPQFLTTVVKLTQTYENIGIAYSDSNWVDSDSKKGKSLSLPRDTFFKKGKDEIKSSMAIHCTVPNVSSCIIKKTAALEAIEGLGKYKACGDWVFYIRVLNKYNIAYTGQKLNYFRWYHNNISNTAEKNGVWATEGVNILTNIDYRTVIYTFKEFSLLSSFWLKKGNGIAFDGRMTILKTVAQAFGKFLQSKITHAAPGISS